jgi:hypothetical protein
VDEPGPGNEEEEEEEEEDDRGLPEATYWV